MTAEHADMRFCRWLVILMVGFLACHPLIAAEAPSDDSLFYYKIGGGARYCNSPQPQYHYD